jgi:hypothetical protein
MPRLSDEHRALMVMIVLTLALGITAASILWAVEVNS